MLIDPKTLKTVNPDNLPKGRDARQAALATLREVLVPRAPGKHEGFKLGERASLKGAR